MSEFKIPNKLKDKLLKTIYDAEWYWECSGTQSEHNSDLQLEELSIEDGDVDRVINNIVLDVLDAYIEKDKPKPYLESVKGVVTVDAYADEKLSEKYCQWFKKEHCGEYPCGVGLYRCYPWQLGRIQALEGILNRIKTAVIELEATPLTLTLQGNAYAMGLKTAGRKITLAMTLTSMKEGSA